MLNEISQSNIKKKMNEVLIYLENEIKKLNITGINYDLISNLLINYYGNLTKLKYLSKISIENKFSLRISLFDKKIKNIVEKTILLSKLDLNLSNDIKDIIITVPVITQERKKDILKIIKKKIELAKVSIRNKRKLIKNKIVFFLKEKIINKEQEKSNIKKLQEIVNFYIKEINFIYIKQKKKMLNN